MDDVSAVTVVDRRKHLLDNIGRILLTEVLLLRYALEELSSIA